MSTIKVDTIKNGAGTREYFPCTAWVNFDGSGTVAIRDSGNVSSITDNGTGRFTINFATALSSANYAYSGTSGNEGATTTARGVTNDAALSTTGFSVRILLSTTAADDPYIGVIVHGGIS